MTNEEMTNDKLPVVYAQSIIRSLQSVIRHSPSAILHPPFPIRHLSFVICSLVTLLPVLLFLAACSSPTDTAPASPVPIDTPTLTPTPTPLPPSPGATAAAFLEAWGVSNYGTMYSLLSPESQRRLTVATNMMPTNRSLLDDPVITGSELMKNSLSQIEVGRTMPVVPELRAVWDAMRPSYQAVLGGAIGAEKAAADMQKEALKKIREMNTQIEPASYVSLLRIIVLFIILAFLVWQRKSFVEFLRDFKRRPFI